MLWTLSTLSVFVSLSLCCSVLGWRAAIRPADHPVANFEFDTVVGADGRRNTLEGETIAQRRRLLCIITHNILLRNAIPLMGR